MAISGKIVLSPLKAVPIIAEGFAQTHSRFFYQISNYPKNEWAHC